MTYYYNQTVQLEYSYICDKNLLAHQTSHTIEPLNSSKQSQQNLVTYFFFLLYNIDTEYIPNQVMTSYYNQNALLKYGYVYHKKILDH